MRRHTLIVDPERIVKYTAKEVVLAGWKPGRSGVVWGQVRLPLSLLSIQPDGFGHIAIEAPWWVLVAEAIRPAIQAIPHGFGEHDMWRVQVGQNPSHHEWLSHNSRAGLPVAANDDEFWAAAYFDGECEIASGRTGVPLDHPDFWNEVQRVMTAR